jgi:hypothetical protein
MMGLILLILISGKEIGVDVSFVTPEWMTGAPAVVLTDTARDRILPIFIGEAEARSIQWALEGIEPPRPMTHDLLVRILKKFGMKVEKVVITNLEDNTYFAELYLKQGRKRKIMDSRPSDAIAIALRVRAPVFVIEDVFDEAEKIVPKEEEKEKKKKRGDI